MKKILLTLAIILATVSIADAQAIPTSRLGWDQDAPTLADAQAYTYKYYADGSTTGVILTGITCTGTASPFICSATFPAFTPGNHRMTLSASNVAGESAQSLPLDFTFIVTPAVPRGLRILGG